MSVDHLREALPVIKKKKYKACFDREPINEITSGFVLDYSDDLVLVNLVDCNFRLSGYSVVRYADIQYYSSSEDNPFEAAAIKKLELKPEPLKGVDLSGMEAAITSAQKLFPILSIHRELKDNEFLTGMVVDMGGGKFTMCGPDTDMRDIALAKYSAKDVTRVDFGTGFEEAVELTLGKAIRAFAGKQPMKGRAKG